MASREHQPIAPEDIDWDRELGGTRKPVGRREADKGLVALARRHPVAAILAAVVVVLIGVRAIRILVKESMPVERTVGRFNQDVSGTGFQRTDRVIAELASLAARAESEIREAAEEGRRVNSDTLREAGLSDAEIEGVVAGDPILTVLRDRMIRVMGQHGRMFGREQMGQEFADQVARTAKRFGPTARASDMIRGVGEAYGTLIGDALPGPR